MVLVNCACHTEKGNGGEKDMESDTVMVDQQTVSSKQSFSAEIDTSSMNPNDTIKGSFTSKPIKSKTHKNKLSPKRKESPKKGLTSIRAERRKQKSK